MSDANANWLLFGGFIAVLLVLAAVSSARDKRAGTGKWERYGPNPSKEHIARVNRAGELYRDGLRAFMLGDMSEASRSWQESSMMGDPRALTGLGILARRRGNAEEADSYWMRARAAGDVPAHMLMLLDDDTELQLYSSDLALLILENQLPHPQHRYQEATATLIGVAVHFGLHDYAKKLAREANELAARNGYRRVSLDD